MTSVSSMPSNARTSVMSISGLYICLSIDVQCEIITFKSILHNKRPNFMSVCPITDTKQRPNLGINDVITTFAVHASPPQLVTAAC